MLMQLITPPPLNAPLDPPLASVMTFTPELYPCILTVGCSQLSYSLFHPFEVVSRCRDAQLQVGENYPYLFNLMPNI